MTNTNVRINKDNRNAIIMLIVAAIICGWLQNL